MRARLVREIEKERERSASDPVLAQALKLAMAATQRPSRGARFFSTGSQICCLRRLIWIALVASCVPSKKSTRSSNCWSAH